MPRVWQSYIKKGVISGLWRITEDEAELRAQLHVFPAETFVASRRNLEWLASRVLLQELLADAGFFGPFKLSSDASGKPVLDLPGIEISISHSGDFAAVVISEKSPVGVDIELVRPKISRIYPKFMNGPEIERLKHENDLHWMSLVWSAKESLFKYYGNGELDFKEHLHIGTVHENHLVASIRKDDFYRELTLIYRFMDDYVITWALDRE